MSDFTNIIEEINTNIPDNNTQLITAKKVRDTLIDLVHTVGDGKEIFNLNELLSQTSAFSSKQNARAALTTDKRAIGIQITYLLSLGSGNSKWITEQFIGSNVSGWGSDANWETVGPVDVNENSSEGGYDITIGDLNKANVASQEDLIYPAEWIDGKYLRIRDGHIVNQAGWSISNIFPVVEDMYIKLNGTVSGNVVAAVVFSDESGTTITSTGGMIPAGTFTNQVLTIPEGAAFVQFCKNNNYDFYVNLKKPAYQEKFNKEIIETLSSAGSFKYAELPLTWIDDQYVSKTDGSINNYAGAHRTDYIKINKLSPLYLSGIFRGSSVAACSFYDSEKKWISSYGSNTYSNSLLDVPSAACYIMLSTTHYNGYDDTSCKLHINTAPQAIVNGVAGQPLYVLKKKWFNYNYIHKGDGVIYKYTQSDWKVSQNIYVEPTKYNYYIKTTDTNNPTSASLIAFYSADGTFIGELYGGAYDYEKIVFPSGATTTYMIVGQFTNGKITEVYTNDPNINNNLNYNDEPDSYNIADRIKAGGTINLANRNYIIDTQLEVPSNCHIIGGGKTVMYLGTGTGSTAIFHLDNKENVQISGINFQGQTSITPGTPGSITNPSVMDVAELRSRSLEGTKRAIYIENGDRNNVIENCVFQGFNLAGVHFYRSHDTHFQHAKITNCQFFRNWYGLLLDVRAEFTNVTNCSFNRNKVGVFVAGGNNVFGDNHYDGNEVGFCVCSYRGENADHGSSCNCTHNHNTVYGLAAVDVGSGFLFANNNHYGGGIMLSHTQGVQIINSKITVPVTDEEHGGSGMNSITNSMFSTHYQFDPTGFNQNDKLLLKNNCWLNGDDASNLNN